MKRWLITGCSGGLGLALAAAALRRGDAVAGTSRRSGARSPDEAGAERWHGLALDVTDPAAVQAVVAEAARRLGGLDIVVNNAGYALAGAVEEVSPGEAQAQMAVNVLGPLYVMQAALPHLRAAGGGRILNIASFAAVQGLGGLGLYSATKFALSGLSEALSAETSAMGIRVIVVEPTALRTQFAGPSLAWAAGALPVYASLRTSMRQGFERSNGRQPNDATRAAEALLVVADLADPPLHLALGVDAEPRIRAVLDARIAEYAAFAGYGSDTGFDG